MNCAQENSVDLSRLVACPEAIACLPEVTARRLNVVPVALTEVSDNHCLVLAMPQHSERTQRDRLQRHLGAGVNLKVLTAKAEQIGDALNKCYGRDHALESLLEDARAGSRMRPMGDLPGDFYIVLMEALLREACRRRASDIHLSPSPEGFLVRFRIDGVLEVLCTLDSSVIAGLALRIKVMAALDIAESRLPQDGQFEQLVDGRTVEFRVSMMPTIHGENAVLRILGNQPYDSLASLSLPESCRKSLTELLHRPDGLIIVCGPTGAGKSTTLFALLSEKDQQALNIMTLEDPVEHRLPGIRQTNIDPARLFDYPQGLKAMLRQDPDVMLIGEIRDSQSCEMALRAVTSGHQVLTTIHAGSAHATLTRLRELGAKSHVLASCLSAIIAQRLVRKTCQMCKGAGERCGVCHGTGFHGRQIVLEILQIDDTISRQIADDANVTEIVSASLASGFTTMRQQGQHWVDAGIVSGAELDRVLGRDIARKIARVSKAIETTE